jgi:hypothetical protein
MMDRSMKRVETTILRRICLMSYINVIGSVGLSRMLLGKSTSEDWDIPRIMGTSPSNLKWRSRIDIDVQYEAALDYIPQSM